MQRHVAAPQARIGSIALGDEGRRRQLADARPRLESPELPKGGYYTLWLTKHGPRGRAVRLVPRRAAATIRPRCEFTVAYKLRELRRLGRDAAERGQRDPGHVLLTT